MNGPAAVSGPLLSVRNLAVHFGGLVAISDLSFDANEHEITSLIGPNGAGKTTAFNAITGFLPPAKGTIHFRGEHLDRLRPHQIAERGVVRTFQKTSVFGGISVVENLMIGLHRRGRGAPWEILLGLPRVGREERALRRHAGEILRFVGLDRRMSELGSALPYGEQRLLEVAIALAADPTLLLLDEPVSGMNPSETESFMVMIEKIRGRGITVLLVEHDMRMVMGVSDRVVVLNQGRIIAEGPPDAVRHDPAVIEAYLGHGRRRA